MKYGTLAGIIAAGFVAGAGTGAVSQQADPEQYAAYVDRSTETVFGVLAQFCAGREPTDARLAAAGYVQNETGVWVSGPTVFSYGIPLSDGARYHCVISVLYPGGSRDMAAGDLFSERMQRSLSGRFWEDPEKQLEIKQGNLNATFVITDRATNTVLIDGAFVPPAPAIANEVGGIVVNVY